MRLFIIDEDYYTKDPFTFCVEIMKAQTKSKFLFHIGQSIQKWIKQNLWKAAFKKFEVIEFQIF